MRLHSITTVAAVAFLCCLVVFCAVALNKVQDRLYTQAAQVAPTWCNWPADADQAALTKAINAEVANIHKYSPDYTPDRFTLQLDLMSRCGAPAGVRQ